MFTKILSATLALSLLTPGVAHADDKLVKNLVLTGTGLMVASFVMMAAASKEVSTCTTGMVLTIYNQHPVCVRMGTRTVTVSAETTRPVTVKPGLFNAGKYTLWASFAVSGAGIVTSFVQWKRAKKVMPDLMFTPDGVMVGKRVSF